MNMTARDDYPELAVMAQHGLGADDQEAERALDEIDQLRAKLAAIQAISDDVVSHIPTFDPGVPWDGHNKIRVELRRE